VWIGELVNCLQLTTTRTIYDEVNNAIEQKRMVSLFIFFFYVSFNWSFTPVDFEHVYGFRIYDVDTLMIIVLWTFFLHTKEEAPELMA
jgi:hypothetical protein